MMLAARILLGSAGIALAILVAPGCGRATAGNERATSNSPAYPVEIRDDRGHVVRITAEPRRIVALLPSHTETLFALGLGDRIVGVDDFSDDPPEAASLPKLGGLYDARLELILAARPDLVLLSEASSAASPLEQNGIAVWAGSARTFDDVFRVIDAIGRIVDRRARAAELAEQVRNDVAAIERALADVEPVRVYYELDATPYSVGPGSFIGVLLAKARGTNVVPAALGDFPKISPELVIAGDPQVIIGAPLAGVAARPGWNRIRAVREGRVYDPPRSEAQLVARPGPRIAEGLRLLARLLHPEIVQ